MCDNEWLSVCRELRRIGLRLINSTGLCGFERRVFDCLGLAFFSNGLAFV